MAKKKHLILGAGSAGLSAAEEIRRLNSEDEIKVVSAEDAPPYSPTVLPYLLSGRIDAAQLSMRKAGYFKNLKITFVKGKKVTQLLPNTKEVVYRDGTKETYDTLLIATGADSIQPPIPGLAENYIGFHTATDCKSLMDQLSGKKQIAVLGAGLVGMEVAIALVEKGYHVSIIEKEPRILPLYFDPQAEAIIREMFVQKGVQLLTGKTVSGVAGKNGKVEISVTGSAPVTADMLVTCIGVRSRMDFIKGSGLSANRGILVNSKMATSIPDVYAAGDVAEAPDFFKGEYGMNQIIESAVDEGKTAGSNMAGVAREYPGWISSNVFNFFGNSAFSAGVSQPAGDGYEVLKDSNKNQFKKLVFNGNKLVGAMFVNVEVDPGVILYLIEKKLDVSRVKSFLFQQPRESSRCLMLQTEEAESAPIQG